MVCNFASRQQTIIKISVGNVLVTHFLQDKQVFFPIRYRKAYHKELIIEILSYCYHFLMTFQLFKAPFL